MGLKEYRSKRKFGKTPEPKPVQAGRDLRTRPTKTEGSATSRRISGKHLLFVVHKHAARALHYDLRLELKGVLKSWAVPKGPSRDPTIKRLAIMVEDHPLEYKDFEGIIPEGNYGAGGVLIWDRGYYRHPSAKDRDESEKLLWDGLRKGDMKFVLAGKKLQGEFALVKAGKDEKSWLLLKKEDRYATSEDILGENRSVVTNRTLEEIAEAGPRRPSPGKRAQIRLREALESKELKDAPLKPMPHSIAPMLASAVKEPFNDPDWIFEVKWDGYRAIAEIRGEEVSLYSRNLLPLNKKFPSLAESLQKCRFEAVLDGEIVVTDDQGRPDFEMLQNYRKSGSGHLLFYVFDLLHFEGRDLTALPLIRRKELLKKILPPDPRIRFSDHVEKEGVPFFNAVKGEGIEGMLAKHAQSRYRIGGRSPQWLKVKARLTQEGVIAGFTAPRGSRKNLGSLVLGVYEGDDLKYIGHSGGGFGAKTLRDIRRKLEPLIQEKCPFQVRPETDTPVTWVKPTLVCEVSLSGWTGDGILRQPVFLRLREDKTAREVVREIPESL